MNWNCRPSARPLAAVVAMLTAAACADSPPTSSETPLQAPVEVVQLLACEGSLATGAVKCAPTQPGTGGARAIIFGGQGTYVQVTGTNAAYNSGTEIWSIDMTIQNLTNEAIGTYDGTTPDVNGIRVFFHSGPTVTGGSGAISVANADGTGTFTAPGQPYFQYNEVLDKDEVSSSKTWQLNVQPTVTTFSFILAVSTEVQPLLVINEVLVNPGGTITDANGEWFEVYNAGSRSVDLQNMVIADSAASGRRPYHLIASSLTVAPGGYVVLGNTTNTTNNGGVTVDYQYGAALQLANSLDAVKISRVVGTDTLTIDRTQYSSAAISAQNGISRELKNPALDNSNMDGSNWADALVTAVYGPGGRGTPKAQNSTFTP